MLPPHRPFVRKIVKRRTIRRSSQEKLVGFRSEEAAGRQGDIRIARRVPQRLKPALRVLGQTQSRASVMIEKSATSRWAGVESGLLDLTDTSQC